MATRQRKAEKHRKKRQAKAREQRVLTLRHEHRAKSDAHPLFACSVNEGWDEDGKASIFVVRTISPGRLALASFLVDTWGMGLKDAWGRIDLPVGEWSEMVERAESQSMCMIPLNLRTAKHLVFGGIQLAQEVGFRLPRRYEHWTAILGALPAGESPDRSLLLDEGRIHVMCSLRDLEARLIGTSVKKFLLRKDITITIGDDDFTLMDDETEGAEAAMEQMVESLVDAATQWCFANQQKPHPLLPAVASAIVEAAAESIPEDLNPDAPVESLSDSQQEDVARRAGRFLSTTLNVDNNEVKAAIAQFTAFTGSANSPKAFADMAMPDDA